MSRSKIVVARKAGRCWNDCGLGLIESGDRIRVTTAFPRDEVLGAYIHDGKPLYIRECAGCTREAEERYGWKEPS
jgi:hypothetical protein